VGGALIRKAAADAPVGAVNLAAAITHTGTTVSNIRYQLAGLHGDIITTTSPKPPPPTVWVPVTLPRGW